VLYDRTEGGPWSVEETRFFIHAAKELSARESEPWAELIKFIPRPALPSRTSAVLTCFSLRGFSQPSRTQWEGN
jgi:hypothetical protein